MIAALQCIHAFISTLFVSHGVVHPSLLGNKEFLIIEGLRLDMAHEGTESAFNGPTILSISKDLATLLRMLKDFKLNSKREIELPRTDIVWKPHKEKENTLITLPPSPEDQGPCIAEIKMKATRDDGNGSTATLTENVIIQQTDLQKPVVFGRRKDALFEYLFRDSSFCRVEVILYPAKERSQLVLPAHKTFKGKGILIFCEKDEKYRLCRDGVIIEIPFVNHFRFAVLRSGILVNVDLHMKWNIPDGRGFPPAPGGGNVLEANLSTNVDLETGDTL